jgi:hypothetical protein
MALKTSHKAGGAAFSAQQRHLAGGQARLLLVGTKDYLTMKIYSTPASAETFTIEELEAC